MLGPRPIDEPAPAMSPSAFLVAGGSLGVALAFGVNPLLAVGIGALAWLARVGQVYLTPPATDRPAPWRVAEPWRNFVTTAVAADRRLGQVIHVMQEGPLRERVESARPTVREAINGAWRVALVGSELSSRGESVAADAALQRLRSIEASLAHLVEGTAGLALLQADETGSHRALAEVEEELGALKGAVAELAHHPSNIVPPVLPRSPRRSNVLRQAIPAAAAVVFALTILISANARSDRPTCRPPRPLSLPDPRLAPASLAALVSEGPLPLQDAAGGKYGTAERLARLSDLGAISARAELWSIGGLDVDVRTIDFPSASAAASYAATDTEVICAFASSTFDPEGVLGAAGVRQAWAEGPDGYWVGAVDGTSYVRAYTRADDEDAGRRSASAALASSLARRSR